MPAPSLQHLTSQLPDFGDLPTGGGTADVRLTAHLPLASGVEATVDPLAPDHWQSIRGLPVSAEEMGQPGLRLAAVDALDRWLQLPVNDGLLQAERAIARADVAAFLDEGSLRAGLLDDAVSLARAAQPQLEAFLEQLARPVPDALLRATRRLIAGLVDLAKQTPDADDLRVLAKIGERLRRYRGAAVPAQLPRAPGIDDEYVGDRTAGLLDPRLVPARVVRFSDDPTLGEVRVTRTEIGDIPVLEVDVPAVGALDVHVGDAAARDRLHARFVDLSAGLVSPRVLARLLLTHEPARNAFSARLPLREGMNPDHLRVEIVHVGFDRPPTSDGLADVIEVRRAAIRLRRWRLLASYRQLGIIAEPELLRAVRSVSGDPTATVQELDGGDSPVDATTEADRRRIMTTGAGEPLVAELAYAYAIGMAQE